MASLLEPTVAVDRADGDGASLTVVVVAACPFPAPRGTPIRILRLSEAIARRGHRVHVVTYHNGSGEVPEGLTVHRIPQVSTYRKLSPGPSYQKLAVLDPLLAWKLSRVIHQYRPDVIHAHHYEGLLMAAAARAGTGTPIVYDAHTMLSSELPFYSMGLPVGVKRFVAERFDRWLPALARHAVTVTAKIAEKLVALGAMPSNRVTVVPNGVELERFGFENNGAARADRHGNRVLIFTGNLAPYQGIENMLGAFRKVLDRRRDVRLMIVAGSSTLEQYEPMARELGIREAIDVVPAGFDRIPALLSASDVAINPRVDCDGIPLKLLNYLAASRPVVSFQGAAPGLRHRESGWLAADGDLDALADGVLTVLDDPGLAGHLGRNGRCFVEANHSWDRSAELAEEVFLELVAARAARRR